MENGIICLSRCKYLKFIHSFSWYLFSRNFLKSSCMCQLQLILFITLLYTYPLNFLNSSSSWQYSTMVKIKILETDFLSSHHLWPHHLLALWLSQVNDFSVLWFPYRQNRINDKYRIYLLELFERLHKLKYVKCLELCLAHIITTFYQSLLFNAD